MKDIHLYIYKFLVPAASLLMTACSEDIVSTPESGEVDHGIIEVGVTSGELSISSTVTRANEDLKKPAEQETWLIQPLKKGLDITYGLVGKESSTEKVAILQLRGGTINDNEYDVDPTSGLAIYTFNYREDNTPARWYGNGPHYFEGVHVPNRLRYVSSPSELADDNRKVLEFTGLGAVNNLTTDQSDGTNVGTDNQLGNYTLLTHYLGMPANTRISATVGRILLPFSHRLAHVLAYIIIDPALGTQIKGYKSTANEQSKGVDDPKTTSFRFCNVDVLSGVKDSKDDNDVHTLTPTWAEKVRKVIPHFYGEEETLVVYESAKKKVYPKSDGYDGVNGVHTKYTNAYNAAIAEGKTPTEAIEAAKTASGGYEKKEYFAVPVYDLIVRPTYTKVDNVMYDEDLTGTSKAAIADLTNQIDFDLGLENGLNYTKHFVFDLDANYETVVYLHITRARVDYNQSGTQVWQVKSATDDWYGLDNLNGNTLSKAGSTWQRAFYCNSPLAEGSDKITDGSFYDQKTSTDDNSNGQYLNEATWKEYFAQAYEGGAHHGDYFVLDKNITIDARSLPDNFVFTGHLDGFNPKKNTYHTITLENAGKSWKEYEETDDYTSVGTLYSAIPEKYSNAEGTIYEVPSSLFTKTDHDAVYYQSSELTEVGGETYVTASLVFHEAVPVTKYEEEDLVIIGEKTYVKTSVKYNEETYTYSLYADEDPAHNIVATAGETVKTPAVDEYYEVVPSSIAATTETIKTAAWTEYNEASPSIAEIMGSTVYYLRSGSEGSYTYTAYDATQGKPSALYRMKQQHTSGTYLFAGLNGNYLTNQESANPEKKDGKVIYQANVHKEKTNGKDWWLPYRTETDGWRAEVINITVTNAPLFKLETEETPGAVITGYVQNCKDTDGQTKVPDHVPAIPQYK